MRINLGLSVMGEDPTKPSYYHHLHRDDVAKRIKKHPAIDEWTKDFLLKRMSQYPDNALAHFVKNINQIVVTAINERSRVKKEEFDARQKEAGINEVGPQIDSTGSGNGVKEDQQKTI